MNSPSWWAFKQRLDQQMKTRQAFLGRIPDSGDVLDSMKSVTHLSLSEKSMM